MPALPKPILLSGKCEQEFAALCARIAEEVKPKDAVEELFVADIGRTACGLSDHRTERME